MNLVKRLATRWLPGMLVFAAVATAEPVNQAGQYRGLLTEHLMFCWELEAIEGQADEAGQLITRMTNYLRANHDAPLAYVGAYLNFAPDAKSHPRLGERPVPVFQFYLGFVDFDVAQATFGKLRTEEGWLALEQQMEGVFEQDEATIALLFPVAFHQIRALTGNRPFRIVRRARATYDNYERALRLARDEVDYINKNYEGAYAAAWSEELDEFGVVRWFLDFESASAWRNWSVKIRADQGYLAIKEGSAGLFVDGSVSETATAKW